MGFLQVVVRSTMTHLVRSAFARDAFVAGGHKRGRQAQIVQRESRGKAVYIIGIGIGYRGQFCSRILAGDHHEAVDRRFARVMRLHGKMGVIQCVDQRTG
ncbi:hypothetical protein XI03_37805 [Bradyrhizobium sp. CCBAU 65884]|nr:hypothetical protein [Bradyrhizobium sp. CCBAU 65884]